MFFRPSSIIYCLIPPDVVCYTPFMLQYRDTPTGQVVSAGYPTVEDLIDSENFDVINKTFEAAYQQLEGLARHKGGMKKSEDVRRAMVSIETVMDLLRELLSIKYQLQALNAGQKPENK